MSIHKSELRTRGKSLLVPTCIIEGQEVVSAGRWLRIATIKDEEWLEGQCVGDPKRFVARLRASALPADLFAFSGPIDAEPERIGHVEIDNAAAIKIGGYQTWWDGLSQAARRNVRLAEKKGIEVRSASFDHDFAVGIKAIYDESPIRQGRRFWHYGKEFERVMLENASYLDRSEFIGAYFSGHLVGFLKFVHVDSIGRIMQILSLETHRDKRPMSALIAKAVEICDQKGLKYLVYGKFAYGTKIDGLAEFKRRMGFEVKTFPRYYIPLSLRGKMAIWLGVHAGWQALLPPKFASYLRSARTWGLEQFENYAGVWSRGRRKRLG